MRNSKGQFVKGTHWRNKRSHWDKEWLYDQYVTQEKPAVQIASEQGISENGILYWLHKLGIQTRSTSDVRQVKHWGSVGADNPMWNKRGELNQNWKGGITQERQAYYQSQEWKTACREVWKRDNATCQRCGVSHKEGIPLHIHHKKSFKHKDLRAAIDNLILVCDVCHHFIHSRKNVNLEFIDDKHI